MRVCIHMHVLFNLKSLHIHTPSWNKFNLLNLSLETKTILQSSLKPLIGVILVHHIQGKNCWTWFESFFYKVIITCTERSLEIQTWGMEVIPWAQTQTNYLLTYSIISTASACLTIIHVFQDVDFGGGIVHSQAPPDRQRQSDIEALFSLVQRVVDDHHATLLLPLTLVEAKDAAVLLRTGDVVRVRQDGGGNSPWGRTFRGTKKRRGEDGDRSGCPTFRISKLLKVHN